MPAAILILAAGASARMRGTDKLLEIIDGTPQLRRAAQAALQTGCALYVTLPEACPQRRAALAGLDLTIVDLAGAAKGMGASLRAGLAALPQDTPVLVLLADLPEITGDDLEQVLTAHAETPAMILRATDAQGLPGHPVLFPPWVRGELGLVDGDQGARDILRRHSARIRTVALPGHHATTDLDTPEDWARWRAASER